MNTTQTIAELKSKKREIERTVRDYQFRLAQASAGIKNFAVSGWQGAELQHAREEISELMQTGKEAMQEMDTEIKRLAAEIAHLERGRTTGKKFGF